MRPKEILGRHDKIRGARFDHMGLGGGLIKSY
jgi:hypothetical protein